MKKSIVLSAAIVLVGFALQAQPKYTKMATNQSGFKVQNLDGYQETGGKVSDRNAFMNAQSYKGSTKVKPEAKGEGFFPILPEGINQNSMVADGNYKTQFRSRKRASKAENNVVPTNAIPTDDSISSQ